MSVGPNWPSRVPACCCVLHLEDTNDDAFADNTDFCDRLSVMFLLAAVSFSRKTTLTIPLQTSLSSMTYLVEFLVAPVAFIWKTPYNTVFYD